MKQTAKEFCVRVNCRQPNGNYLYVDTVAVSAETEDTALEIFRQNHAKHYGEHLLLSTFTSHKG